MEELKHEEVSTRSEYSKLKLNTYYVVSSVKSIRRSIKKGKVSLEGIKYPKRPYNNRANTSKRSGIESRYVNVIKREIYDRIR